MAVSKERIEEMKQRILATRTDDDENERIRAHYDLLEETKARIRHDLQVRLALIEELSQRTWWSRVRSWLGGGP